MERATATATLGGVGVFEREALLFEAFVPIDRGAIQVQSALFVDDNFDAMTIEFAVDLFIELVIEIQRIAETAATASGDSNSKDHVIAEIVFGLKPLHFFCGSFAQFDCHLFASPLFKSNLFARLLAVRWFTPIIFTLPVGRQGRNSDELRCWG